MKCRYRLHTHTHRHVVLTRYCTRCSDVCDMKLLAENSELLRLMLISISFSCTVYGLDIIVVNNCMH
jgi:hypothetical protein